VATVFYPPAPVAYTEPTVFLAGSIDQGRAVDWQAQVIEQLDDLEVGLINPRRPDWDASWDQSDDNPKFVEQVQWELEGIERATIVLMVFAKDSVAPISLLELGIRSQHGNMIVVCPPGFWRKGNVDQVCARYQVPRFDSLEKGLAQVRHLLAST